MLCLCLAALFAPAAPTPDSSSSAWNRFHGALLADGGVVRCHSQPIIADGRIRFPDDLGTGADLLGATPSSGAGDTVTLVKGRWEGRRAVRLDAQPLRAPACVQPGQPFSVEMWFRKNGAGVHRGNDNATNGTLISEGNGYWDGWRITTSYPEGTFGFEIGRPQPARSAGLFGCGPLPDGVWHHVAATWDGKTMRLYLNGILAGSHSYSGGYTPGDVLRVGYADAGWGSVKLDVDCVILWRRALSSVEVLRSALYYVSVPNEQSSRLARAGELLHGGRPAEAARLCEAVIQTPRVAADVRALAMICLADCRRRLSDVGGAARALAVATQSGVSYHLRRTALSRLLAFAPSPQDVLPEPALRAWERTPLLDPRERWTLRLALMRRAMASGSAATTSRLVTQMLEDPDMDAAAKFEIRLMLAHVYRRSKQYVKARKEYEAIAADEQAPPAFRQYARMLVLRTLLQAEETAEARRVCQSMLADVEAPLASRYEAQLALQLIQHRRKSAASRRGIALVPLRTTTVRTVAPRIEIHVAPSGSDRNPGTRQKPLASWLRALAVIRRLKAQGALPRGGLAVTFHAGVYPVSTAVTITTAEAGTSSAPVVFRAAPGEKVVFRGGVRLRTFQPVRDPALLSRIRPDVRQHILELDLRAAGITDPGRLSPRGVGSEPRPCPELYWNGHPLTLARWPDAGWASTARIVQERNEHGGFTFEYEGERPSHWAGESNGWLFGYFGWLWADHGVKLASVDTTSHQLLTAHPSSYAPRQGMPWFAYNILAELDRPGEWYYDEDNSRILVYPPTDPSRAVVEYPTLDTPFVIVEGASHVRMEGLVFDLGRWNGIEVRNSSNILIAGCTVQRLRGTAVVIDGGRNCGVFGCELATLGRNGTWVRGGDRKTLQPAGHFVENCHIHDFSRWDRTYTPAAYVEGVGIRIAHNLIHDSPGHAMRIEGNDHLIEFNEVHHVVTETDDQGAVDMWFNPTYRGVVIRHNFFHHIGGGGDDRMRAGVRLDDAICGVLIYGNVFWKASQGLFGGVQIHGGKENEVVNNLFVDCKYAVSFSRWGPQRWNETIQSAAVRKFTTEDVDITSPPYSTRYPALAHLSERPDVNRIWGNMAVGCGDFLTRDGGSQETVDNLIALDDPGFVDRNRGSFALPLDSPVYGRSGFLPLPLSMIGRYPHPLSVPANREASRRLR